MVVEIMVAQGDLRGTRTFPQPFNACMFNQLTVFARLRGQVQEANNNNTYSVNLYLWPFASAVLCCGTVVPAFMARFAILPNVKFTRRLWSIHFIRRRMHLVL